MTERAGIPRWNWTDLLQTTLSVIGRGRMGTALACALGAPEPLPRGSDGGGADVVLLCVPDDQIAAAASLVAPGRLVGHVSGATTLSPLAPHEAFSLHPLMTAAADPARPVAFAGAAAAVAGATPRALQVARALADELGMDAIEIADRHRGAYHAAASIASNYLVALECAAERLLHTAGADRRLLAPLVRATVENWIADGERALTGPIARGDEDTVATQRAAVADRAPELLELFDVLAATTRELVAERLVAS